MLTASCATADISTDQPVVVTCAGWQPIKGERADLDVMSDKLKISIAAHLENGRKNGCWD